MNDKRQGNPAPPKAPLAPPRPHAKPVAPAKPVFGAAAPEERAAALAAATALVAEELELPVEDLVSVPPAPAAAPVAVAAAPAPPPLAVAPSPPEPVRNEPPAAERPTSTPASDARSHKRLAFEVHVDIGSQHNFYAGLTLNISEGGLFVSTHVEHPVGTRLEIRLLLPGDDEPTTIMTEVRWVSVHRASEGGQPGLGLRFVDVPPHVFAKIQSFVQRRDPLYYDDE